MSIWKPVKGYEDLYLVNDCGDVIAKPRVVFNGRGTYVRSGHKLRPGKRGRGNLKYLFVVLSDGENTQAKSVHRIVAEAFLENPNNLPEVNHKDENSMNNAVENLEWCTRQYNMEYSKAKKVGQYTILGEKVAEYKSIVLASKITGIWQTSITNCLTGWSKSAGGYIWKYETEE